MEIDRLRDEFPVFKERAYLNAGTNGPVPAPAAAAANEQLELELEHGRVGPEHWARLNGLSDELRTALASLLGASPTEVALTRSTTDGVETVLRGFPFEPADEILTSDEEHAGVLGPVAGIAEKLGVAVRCAPFAQVAEHVGPQTRLIVVSHVSWMTGSVAPVADLVASGVPVLLDGAQGIGAIPVDVKRLGCSFYAGSGQKWLCGPSASGALYVDTGWIERLGIPHPRYVTLDEQADPLELIARPGATRFDSGEIPGPTAAWLAASLAMFAQAGWDAVHARASSGAAALRDRLSTKVEVIPGGAATLVSFEAGDDPQSIAQRLDEIGVVVRAVPGRPWLRASFGAWNDEADAERLVGAL